MATEQPPSAEQSPPGQTSDRSGYVLPDEQTKRQAQDDQYNHGMNSVGNKIYDERHAQDAAANAAAASGGYHLDPDAMRALLPRWQAVADKLGDALKQAQQLRGLDKPADDEGSTIQKKSADAHAQAYMKSIEQQQAYAQGYADRLKKAIEKYEHGEHDTIEALQRRGRKA